MALVASGELPQRHSPATARFGAGGGGGLLPEEAGLLGGGVVRRLIGAADDPGVAVDHVPECTDVAAGGEGGRLVDLGGLDLPAGQEGLDLIP